MYCSVTFSAFKKWTCICSLIKTTLLLTLVNDTSGTCKEKGKGYQTDVFEFW